MGADSDLRAVIADRGFRRLLGTRLLSQLADGVLQAGLASYVLFSPEKQATGARIAVAFAVLLLPYSVVGPFAGVLIDRWSRRQILVISNVVRAALLMPLAALVVAGNDGPLFVALALGSLGINRFFLSALSAALPHVVNPAGSSRPTRSPPPRARSPSVRRRASAPGPGFAGSGYASAAAIVAAAGGCYLLSAVVATRLGRCQLGPDLPGDTGEESGLGRRKVLAGELAALASGVRYLYHRRAAWNALATLGVFRVAFGVMTVLMVLLQRVTFHRPTDADAGLRGVAVTFVAVAVAVPFGAALTPAAVRRWGAGWWVPGLMVSAGVGLLVLGLPFRQAPLVCAGFLFGLTAQGVKVSVDATVQRTVDDGHRGLVFALYDVLFNVAFVAAAAVAAGLLPGSGQSPFVLVGTATALVAAGTWYWRVSPH